MPNSWFPIERYEKITNSHQSCASCGLKIVKGQVMVSVVRGAYKNNLSWNRYHLEHFIEEMIDIGFPKK